MNSQTQPINVTERQMPLMKKYLSSPNAAWIIDTAKTSSLKTNLRETLNTSVNLSSPENIEIPVVAHPAVGGNSNLPTPGHLLAGAVASCLDISTRMIANRLGVTLKQLDITVDLGVDLRGTLRLDKDVMVGFQVMEIKLFIISDTNISNKKLKQLVSMSESSCVLLQTLKDSLEISITTNL